jgi:hypothetical protein
MINGDNELGEVLVIGSMISWKLKIDLERYLMNPP